ncbi:MAG: hypothetical protein ACR2M0_01120 [Chloroflexia bacterium]
MTDLVAQFLSILPEFLVITALALTVFLGCYGVVRLLHLSARWVTGSVGGLVGAFCLSQIVPAFVNQPAQVAENAALVGNMLGLVAVVSAIYAFSQWTARGWYRLLKQQASARIRAAGRGILRYLRARHAWLGWTVLGIGTVHALFYLPLLARQPWPLVLAAPAVVTGGGAWVLLLGLVGLGLAIETVRRCRRRAPALRLVHIVAAAGFFVVTLWHVGTKLAMR